MSNQNWIRIAILFQTIPFVVLVIQYVIRTRWNSSAAGRAIAWLILAGFLNVVSSLIGAFFQHNEPLEVFRIILRFVVGIGLWNLVRVLQKSRQTDVEQSGVVSLSGSGTLAGAQVVPEALTEPELHS